MNKLSEFCDESRGGAKGKFDAYERDCAGGKMAFKSVGTQLEEIPLRTLSPNDVDFVAGQWRVQNKFDANVIKVRDKYFVLGKRLENTEKNHFEYYSANIVGYNCYGWYVINDSTMVVAKYKTRDGTYWAYGDNVARARAFLGIRLYDEYSDLIHKNVNCEDNKIVQYVKNVTRYVKGLGLQIVKRIVTGR